MDFEGLHSFLAVAKTKSISKAAQYLHVTQPTLSTRLRKIEEGLGFPLLERTWEGVTLTKQGYYFLPYAIQFLQDMKDASTVLTDYLWENTSSFEEVTNNTERLHIGIDTWLLPVFVRPILDVLGEKYPGLEYKFITKPSQIIIGLLEYEGLHLAIFYNKENRHFDHQTVHLVEDEMVLLYCTKKGITVNENFDNIKLLNRDPFILFDNPVLTYHSHITKSLIDWLEIERFHIVDDLNVTLNIIESGIGYTILPKSSVYHFCENPSPSICLMPLAYRIPKIKIQLAYSSLHRFQEPIDSITEKLSTFSLDYNLI